MKGATQGHPRAAGLSATQLLHAFYPQTHQLYEMVSRILKISAESQ